ncbi:hypothelical protein [Mycoplasmopsis californica HAZ160_1]|uniref:Hypothelical protein n=1 Tax=Mycoplasmopsis californica HAZ160_1 TaxID=1397850 RepID=A0AAT9F7V0_9BACT|nr:thermonuclease family protein [Mycoplasmopsis californica]BAP00976.1 hypothelical protein [Mycoplasmopsis californica HAZ160_1]BBG40840.1 hypothelical protein [Mycoplasmopsis californica]BBG41434.1 hypothelical protein [Mycoplasmopsis californica]BBG42027.1 hypothelical protein [Mycoplasmopsis californica]BBG42611.1 hypothelical protein [Mycoplasmopsis californica]
MKNKILCGVSLLAIPVQTFTISAACTKTYWDFRFDTSKTETTSRLVKAEITRHKDGDTFDVEISEDKGDFKKGQEITIRLAGIDTPEKSVDGRIPDPNELKWGEKASKFGKDTLPLGKPVYLFVGEKDGFGRTTADIFFNPKIDKLPTDANGQKIHPLTLDMPLSSYSVEITRAGLTLPYEQDKSKINTYYRIYEYGLIWYTYNALGLALKDAYENGRGFYSGWLWWRKTPADFSKVYKIKPLGNAWKPFWYKEKKSVFTKIEQNQGYIPENFKRNK